MAESSGGEADPDVLRLREKAKKSTLKTFLSMLDDPEIKQMLDKIFVNRGLKMSVYLGFFLVGLFNLISTLNQIFQIGVAGNMVLSATLLTVGSLYIIKEQRKK